jgi:predicted deacylase
MDPFRIGTVDCAPGQFATGVLVGGYVESGAAVEVPLIVLHGAQPGPVLWLGGALHGPEINGIEVIRRVARELVDPTRLAGTVIGAPVQNPLALRDHHRLILREGADVNRVFPGKADGGHTERLAHVLFHEGISRADVVIDLHSNIHPAVDFILVRGGSPAAERSRELAELFGWTLVLSLLEQEASMTGTLMDAALGAGIPAMTLELTPQRELHDDSIAGACEGVLNVMRAMQMLAEPVRRPARRAPIPELLGNTVQVRAGRGGFVHPAREVGTRVQQGDTLAIVRDAYGDEVEAVVSPLDGYLTVFPRFANQACFSGQTVAFVNPVRG